MTGRTALILTLIGASLALADARAETRSPYAGQERREIKALSETDIDDLLAGRGMGLAKAAELNGHPGPAHVLELADRLGLDPGQRTATQALFNRMNAEARRLGSAIIDEERDLERGFAERRLGDGTLRKKLDMLAALQGELRYVHLRAHLEQIAILTPDQIARYGVLRGYAADRPLPADSHPGHSAHRH
jgi:hypothetical protein